MRKNDLLESRGKKIAELKKLNEDAKGDLSEDQAKRFDTIEAEIREIDAKIERANKLDELERRAEGEPASRQSNEWADLTRRFELRQVVNALHENRALEGETAEVVQEMRNNGGYQGIPVPWAAFERRAGETVASGVADPKTTQPIIDRIFADAAAVRMGAQIVNIDNGLVEYPVTTSSVSAGWAATETGNVAGPTVYATTDRPLAPDHTLGIQMKITRQAMKQTGDALEQAIRRDMNGAISEAMDAAVFLGSGSSGEPTGVITGAGGFGITSTAINASAAWSAFRAAVTRFMAANAANSPGDVRLLIRPEVWDDMDNALISGTAVSEWDRLVRNIPAANIVMSPNAADAPTGSPSASTAVLSTVKNGTPPIFVGVWGGVDLIRDPYSDAASGGLRLTGLATMDVTVSRAAQLEILTGIQ